MKKLRIIFLFKTLIFLILSFSSIEFIKAEQHAVFLLDPAGMEKNGPLLKELKFAQEQDVENIIITKSILLRFIENRLEQSKDAFSKYSVFHIPETQFFVLCNVEDKNSDKDLDKVLEERGFKENNFNKITYKNEEGMVDVIPFFHKINAIEFPKEVSIEDLKKIFVTKDESEKNGNCPVLWSFHMAGHGRAGKDPFIIGLRPEVVQDFLRFFNKCAKTVFLTSCFIGEKVRDFLHFKKDINNDEIFEELNYLLIVGAVSEEPTYPEWDLNFKDFFAALDNGNLKKAIRSIVSFKRIPGGEFHGTSNIPQILFPRGISFQATQFDEKIKVLNRVLLRAHEIEKKPISVYKDEFFKKVKVKNESGKDEGFIFKKIEKINDKVALIVYPSIVDVEVKVRPKYFDNEKIFDFTSHVYSRFPTAYELILDKVVGFKAIPNRDRNVLNIIKEADFRRELFKKLSDFQKYPLLNSLLFKQTLDKCDEDVERCLKENSFIYPKFISMYPGTIFNGNKEQKSIVDNYFSKITLVNDNKELKKLMPSSVGVLNFVRDAFLDVGHRSSKKVFLIKEVEGPNDFALIAEIQELLGNGNSIFKDFSKDKILTLEDVIVKTRGGKDAVAKISFKIKGQDKAYRFSFKEDELKDNSDNIWPFRTYNEKRHNKKFAKLSQIIHGKRRIENGETKSSFVQHPAIA